ncbi:uncharacterized protein BDW70DRAFT_154312 [Aspergillus foveolatus]|uniref:uncharacterized protein n=1 Tax=Aspergillus foveolatus TaxID=210207 RepID=UPI003CCCA1ED
MAEKDQERTQEVYDSERTSPHAYALSEEDGEVFKKTTTGVDFRKVGWFNGTMIFTKILFATGVLSLPSALYALGAVGGSISIVAWGAFNTYCFVALGIVGKEVTGLLFIIGYVLVTGSGIVGVSNALNALSHHATCTVWWSFLATTVIITTASIRKLEHVGWLSYVGFLSIYIALFIVVVSMTQRNRPAAAPQKGPYDLGYVAINNPGFAGGMVASSTIFISSAGTSAFLPVISEKRNPKEYNPSLVSAGQTIKMVSYGVALVSLIVSGTLYLHVGAKHVFVCILGRTSHLQPNSVIHWGTWLACTTLLGALAFTLAESIPIFNYLIALVGSVCFAPLAMNLPGLLWLYDHAHYRKGSFVQKVVYLLHIGLVLLGIFFFVGATYGVVKQIIDAYATGQIVIGSVYSCADNSNSF